jgi:hypothetical protein
MTGLASAQKGAVFGSSSSGPYPLLRSHNSGGAREEIAR